MSFQLLDSSQIVFQLFHIQDVIVLDKVSSTNQYLIDNIAYLKFGSVCLAEYQTNGRGRYGKFWISPVGNNIYLSIYWCFFMINKEQLINMLGLVVSVAIREVLERLGVKGIVFKWPNDIYCRERKLVGILVEVVKKFYDQIHIVIGVGVNVTKFYKFFPNNIQMISLEEMGIFIDRNILAASIINELYRSLIEFEFLGFIPFFSRWLFLDSYYNRSVKLLIGNRIVTGIARGIGYDGSFLLERFGFIYSYSYIQKVSLNYCQE